MENSSFLQNEKSPMDKLIKNSKRLCYVLRHKPSSIGLTLDKAGWGLIEEVLLGLRMTREDLKDIVERDDKRRFAIQGDKIRANQGHSFPVDLGYESCDPPAVLFHGTVEHALDSIRETGLEKRNRHHVHLSVDRETATNVGKRRGKPIILKIDTVGMLRTGHKFYVSVNDVWLTEHVPTRYITFPEE